MLQPCNFSAFRDSTVSTPLIALVGVEKGFSRGSDWTPVLAGVALEVMPGEIVAVMGGRLEGKTTLLEIAAGLKQPERGSVILDGMNLTSCSDSQRNELLGREIVWINRAGPALDLEVTKLVGWPLALHGCGRREAEQAAAKALDRVGARECAGRRWNELSNWQRVLVALARAFAGTPRLLVIDDLLDSLGQSATEQASDLLRNLIEETSPPCAVLMSTSDMESAIFADHIWSITRKHTLKRMTGKPTDGGVIPLCSRQQARPSR